MNALDKWDSFYVIVGSSAGALIGLQFVVMTLIADRPPPRRSAMAGRAFSTPTIVHFSIVLLIAALLRAPWPSLDAVPIIAGLIGIGGTVYGLLTWWRMAMQSAYTPDLEDWSFHILAPLAAYLFLIGAAWYAHRDLQTSLFAIGGASLILLFVAIHNAWDATAYHVLVTWQREQDKA
ncbi:MAG TPA: hypothetical protein VGF97_19850 [Rhizomicrobium sp.]|jgi:hypothetical protein